MNQSRKVQFEEVISDRLREIDAITKIINEILQLFESDPSKSYKKDSIALLNEAVDRKSDLIVTIADMLRLPGISERDACKGRYELGILMKQQKLDGKRISDLKIAADMLTNMPRVSSVTLQ